MSPLSTLTFYCFVAFLAFRTKTVTLYTVYQLGFAISFVMLLETYDTIHAMVMRSEYTSERIRPLGTHLLCASGSQSLLIPSFGMAPDSDLHQKHSPGMDYMQDNAAREKQHKKERSTSKIKLKQHHAFPPEDPSTLKVDDHTKPQQDNTIPYVLATTLQHSSSKGQSTTYKSLTPNLNTEQEPNMKTTEIYFPPQTPEVQSNESTFQMSPRSSMHRSKTPRMTRSSEHSYLHPRFRIPIYSDHESNTRNSGTSTPDSSSESSTSTMESESDFQAALRLCMMFGSACSRRRGASRGSGYSNQESEFQMKFREAVWPGGCSKRRAGMLGSETWSEKSGSQAEM